MRGTFFFAAVVSAIILVATVVGPSTAATPEQSGQTVRAQTLEEGTQACPYLKGQKSESSMSCPYGGSTGGTQAPCPYLKEKAASAGCPYSGAQTVQPKKVKTPRQVRNV